MSVDLRVDWCDHKAAEYAVMHWHYSKRMPATIQKPVKIGVWEGGRFIGVIVFACGSSSGLHKPYDIEKMEICELVRVALDSHKTPVTQIIASGIKMLKRENPGLRLIVSFADTNHEHIGTIYQAGNWVYTGQSSESTVYIDKKGHEYHARNIGTYTGKDKHGVKKYNRKDMVREEKRPGKHRYLYPLDRAMRKQITPLARPYPKRETCGQSVEGDTSAPTEGESSILSGRSNDATGQTPVLIDNL